MKIKTISRYVTNENFDRACRGFDIVVKGKQQILPQIQHSVSSFKKQFLEKFYEFSNSPDIKLPQFSDILDYFSQINVKYWLMGFTLITMGSITIYTVHKISSQASVGVNNKYKLTLKHPYDVDTNMIDVKRVDVNINGQQPNDVLNLISDIRAKTKEIIKFDNDSKDF